MNRVSKLQILGPVALFIAVMAAEAAAYGLAQAPQSAFMWYVNIELFGLFQRSHYVLSSAVALPGFQLVGIALPILLIGLYGLFAKKTLPLAIAGNFSFMAAAFLLFAGQFGGRNSFQASLGLIIAPQSDAYLVLIPVLGASVVSLVISHVFYLREIHNRA